MVWLLNAGCKIKGGGQEMETTILRFIAKNL